MILRQFPDIAMVRRLRNDSAKPADTWMNVALNIKCRQANRTGVESPYSLFLNRKGHSYANVSRRQYRIEADTFLFTRPGEMYDLTIDNAEQTEICNIHINKHFFEEAVHALTTSSAQLLDGKAPPADTATDLFTQLYTKDKRIAGLTNQLSVLDPENINGFDMLLVEIIEHLATTNEQLRSKMGNLPFIKTAVKEDIYRRLTIARDYIYSNYRATLDLEAVCREAGMSKFHFLRSFKSCYGVTPYQFLTRVRMTRAAELLRTTGKKISEISDAMGYEYPNSFIKVFQKTYGSAPLQYRGQ